MVTSCSQFRDATYKGICAGHFPSDKVARLAGLLVMVMTVIVAMKVFAVPMIMTGGGPSDSTRVLPLFIYQTAFEFFDMGRAAAMSVFLFVAVMLFSVAQIRIFTRGED